jgi:hypothetical protein
MAEDEEVRACTLEDMTKKLPGEQVSVFRKGRRVGTFTPLSGIDASIPLEERKRRFLEASQKIGERLDELGVTEKEIQRDFEAWKKARRRR